MASILIIDDRMPRRGFLSLVLEQHGHTVCEADDDEQAARLAAETRPDLVLIHVLMPYPNGNTRVRPLNAAFDPPLNRMIFFAAPCMAEEARQLAAACGVTRVITDISDTHALLASITAALTEAPAPPGVPAESPLQA